MAALGQSSEILGGVGTKRMYGEMEDGQFFNPQNPEYQQPMDMQMQPPMESALEPDLQPQTFEHDEGDKSVY